MQSSAMVHANHGFTEAVLVYHERLFLSETSSKSEDPFYCSLCRLSSQNRDILDLRASINNLQLEFSTIKQHILALSNSESGLSKLTLSSHTTIQNLLPAQLTLPLEQQATVK